MKKGPNPAFQALFAKARSDRGITQLELSNQAGVSLRTITQIEAEGHVPKASNVSKLANFFGADLEEWTRVAGCEIRVENPHPTESTILLRHLAIPTNLISIIQGITKLELEIVTLDDIAWVLNMQDQIGNPISPEMASLLLKERNRP